MLDSDMKHTDYRYLERILKLIQRKYKLSDFYVLKTKNGFNSFTLDKVHLETISLIGNVYDLIDKQFLEFGFKRNYYDLRIDGNTKGLYTIVKSNGIDMHFLKSDAHRRFFETVLNIEIPKDDSFDNFTEIDIIAYDSNKDGYYEKDKL